MKSLYTPLLFLVCGFLPTISSQAQCDSSSLTFIAVNAAGGGTFDLTVEYCIGGGVLGTTTGASASTTTFAFGFYGTGITVNSYPASLTSDSTACTNTSNLIPGGLGSDVAVGYITPGCTFNCVSSTAACGTPHSDCQTIVFNLNQLPDSMRLFGAEGNGNPFAGCYPNSDMALNFQTLLAADFLSLSAKVQAQEVTLSWETELPDQEVQFDIQRFSDLEGWQTIESIASESSRSHYLWEGQSANGSFLYRIQSTGINGEVTYSSTVEVTVSAASSIHISPNPAEHILLIQGDIIPGDSYQMTDLQGRVLMSGIINRVGEGEIRIPNELASGMYVLKLQALGKSVVKRIQIR